MLPALLAASRAAGGCQWASWSAVRGLAQAVVSAEAAQAVAQHGRGLVRLPADLVASLDAHLKGAGLTGRTAKLRTRELTDQLKLLVRSPAKGGLQPYRTPDTGLASQQQQQAGAALAGGQQLGPDAGMTPEQLEEQAEMERELEQMAAVLGPEAVQHHQLLKQASQAAASMHLRRTRSGRLTSLARAQLEEHIAAFGVLGLPHELLRTALGLPPSADLASPARAQQLKQATPAYTDTQALAYAMSRLPGCYAAAARIFRELAVRLPGAAPRSLLDFGAGPGTAAWAAQEVWPDSLARVTCVEPSPAMRRLGMRVEAAHRAARPEAPLVRWTPELPRLGRSQREQRSARQGRAELVVASYVLSEVPEPQQRAALLRQLWAATTDLLVLIEPGTPAGSALIQEARAAVLASEGRRAAKLARRTPPAAGAAGADDADGPASGGGPATGAQPAGEADRNIAAKLASRRWGAHVVSPCPHDGACPLAAPGAKAWCHFGTRFQRPRFMQAAKALKGRHIHPADHQDERYSYVVLRRGPRPAAAPDVGIARAFAAPPEHAPGPAGSGAPPDAPDAPLSAAARAAAAEHFGRVDARLGVFGAGLVDRLIALEDLGVDWAGAEATALTLEGAAAAARLAAQSGLLPSPALAAPNLAPELATCSSEVCGEPAAPPAAASDDEAVVSGGRRALFRDLAASRVSAGASSHLDEQQAGSGTGAASSTECEPGQALDAEASLQQQQDQQQRGVDERELQLAAAASGAWSRIIRPPRRRGRHVILDVCAAAPACTRTGSASHCSGGQLERHVVAKSDAAKWMGRAAYKLAQEAAWGDLWPSHYSANPKRTVTRD